MSAGDAETFGRCMAVGGVAVFPADTVYGLACDPDTPDAVRRLYGLKGRAPAKSAAVLAFDLDLALASLPELDPALRRAAGALLPGRLTLLLPNPLRRFPLACAADPETLGLRVPVLTDATAPLAAVRWPVLQSSANLAGGPDPRRIADVPGELREGADLVLDAGELPGVASTVVDLRGWAVDGSWRVAREGAVATEAIARALAAA